MKYIIGVDGGGTKTEASAYSLDGKLINTVTTGFGNVLVNEVEAIKYIIDAIEKCIKMLPERKVDAIYLGLAGSECGDANTKISNILSDKFSTKIKIVNDSVIALASLLKGKDGILTISGTGSISYGIRNGITKTVGGWGNLLGDEGSGYYIAIEALKVITKEEDSDKISSKLTKVLLDKLGYENRRDIINFVYSKTKGEIASLVPTIFECAISGDNISEKLLRKSGRDLARITFKVYQSLNFKETIQVGVKGSILTKVSYVRDEFEKVIYRSIPKVEIVDEELSPTMGAYYLAIKEFDLK